MKGKDVPPAPGARAAPVGVPDSATTEQGRHRAAMWIRRANATLTVVWVLMVPISLGTGLKKSLPFIVFISLYANIVGHLSAWVAARAEVASIDIN